MFGVVVWHQNWLLPSNWLMLSEPHSNRSQYKVNGLLQMWKSSGDLNHTQTGHNTKLIDCYKCESQVGIWTTLKRITIQSQWIATNVKIKCEPVTRIWHTNTPFTYAKHLQNHQYCINIFQHILQSSYKNHQKSTLQLQQKAK